MKFEKQQSDCGMTYRKRRAMAILKIATLRNNWEKQLIYNGLLESLKKATELTRTLGEIINEMIYGYRKANNDFMGSTDGQIFEKLISGRL